GMAGVRRLLRLDAPRRELDLFLLFRARRPEPAAGPGAGAAVRADVYGGGPRGAELGRGAADDALADHGEQGATVRELVGGLGDAPGDPGALPAAVRRHPRRRRAALRLERRSRL